MRARRVIYPPEKDPAVNTALAGHEATLSLNNDELMRRWCQEEARCCPPRLCIDDLHDPERFRTRLETWIRSQC